MNRFFNAFSRRAALCAAALLLAACTVFACGCSCVVEEFDPAVAYDRLLTEVKYDAPLQDMSEMAEYTFYDLPEGATVKMYAAADGTHEDAAIALIGAKAEDVPQLESVLRDYIESRLYETDRYNPEESPKLRNAVMRSSGNIVILCITNDTEAAHKILG